MAKVSNKDKKGGKTKGKTLAEYKEAFNLFDKNGDGYITRDELATCVCYFGMTYTDKELDEHIKEYDTNLDRKIEWKEYLTVVSDPSRTKAPGKSEVLDAFKMFDKNKDGFVDAKELSNAMKSLNNKMPPAEVREMLEAADFNGDGKIDYHEFTTMMFS